MNDLIVVENIAQWQRLKTHVLDSVSSPITKRVYSMALEQAQAAVDLHALNPIYRVQLVHALYCANLPNGYGGRVFVGRSYQTLISSAPPASQR